MNVTVWTAILLMVTGATMLIAGIGAAGLWIAVITVGIALIAIAKSRGAFGPW